MPQHGKTGEAQASANRQAGRPPHRLTGPSSGRLRARARGRPEAPPEDQGDNPRPTQAGEAPQHHGEGAQKRHHAEGRGSDPEQEEGWKAGPGPRRHNDEAPGDRQPPTPNPICGQSNHPRAGAKPTPKHLHPTW
jgi:hypothetical protein